MPGRAREMVAAAVTEGMDMARAIRVLSSLPLGNAQVGPVPVTANYDTVEVSLPEEVDTRGCHRRRLTRRWSQRTSCSPPRP